MGEEQISKKQIKQINLNEDYALTADSMNIVLLVQTKDKDGNGTGNCALYYKSEILKKWFWWNDEYTWEECLSKYGDGDATYLFQITISKSI